MRRFSAAKIQHRTEETKVGLKVSTVFFKKKCLLPLRWLDDAIRVLIHAVSLFIPLSGMGFARWLLKT